MGTGRYRSSSFTLEANLTLLTFLRWMAIKLIYSKTLTNSKRDYIHHTHHEKQAFRCTYHTHADHERSKMDFLDQNLN